MRLLVSLLPCLLLAACATGGPDAHKLDRTLFAYESAIRWGPIDRAFAMIDPELAEQHAWSELERQRFEQLQVSGYYPRGKQPLSETEIEQMVEIRLVNRHTQTERSVTDRQRWRWDAEAGTWWLMSGLPDFSPR